LRKSFDSISRLGICPESSWKYDVNKVYLQPTMNCYKEGNDNTIDSFYRIDENRSDNIELAIRSNHPVTFGTGVSNEFMNYSGGVVLKENSKIIGYHAMIVVGVRNNGRREFLVRNSWGENWGIKGYCWISESFIEWEKTSDIWCPTLMSGLTL